MNFPALLLGILITGFGIYLGKKNGIIKKWAKAEGKMLHKEVIQTKEAAAIGPPAFRFEAAVKYEYTVNGKTYTNDRVLFNAHALKSKPDAEQFINGLSEKVTVLYDPKNPANACLFTMPAWVFGMVVGFGLFFVIVGLASNA